MALIVDVSKKEIPKEYLPKSFVGAKIVRGYWSDEGYPVFVTAEGKEIHAKHWKGIPIETKVEEKKQKVYVAQEGNELVAYSSSPSSDTLEIEINGERKKLKWKKLPKKGEEGSNKIFHPNYIGTVEIVERKKSVKEITSKTPEPDEVVQELIKEGKIKPEDVGSVVPVTDNKGKVRGYVIFTPEETKQREIERRALQKVQEVIKRARKGDIRARITTAISAVTSGEWLEYPITFIKKSVIEKKPLNEVKKYIEQLNVKNLKKLAEYSEKKDFLGYIKSSPAVQTEVELLLSAGLGAGMGKLATSTRFASLAKIGTGKIPSIISASSIAGFEGTSTLMDYQKLKSGEMSETEFEAKIIRRALTVLGSFETAEEGFNWAYNRYRRKVHEINVMSDTIANDIIKKNKLESLGKIKGFAEVDNTDIYGFEADIRSIAEIKALNKNYAKAIGGLKLRNIKIKKYYEPFRVWKEKSVPDEMIGSLSILKTKKIGKNIFSIKGTSFFDTKLLPPAIKNVDDYESFIVSRGLSQIDDVGKGIAGISDDLEKILIRYRRTVKTNLDSVGIGKYREGEDLFKIRSIGISGIKGYELPSGKKIDVFIPSTATSEERNIYYGMNLLFNTKNIEKTSTNIAKTVAKAVVRQQTQTASSLAIGKAIAKEVARQEAQMIKQTSRYVAINTAQVGRLTETIVKGSQIQSVASKPQTRMRKERIIFSPSSVSIMVRPASSERKLRFVFERNIKKNVEKNIVKFVQKSMQRQLLKQKFIQRQMLKNLEKLEQKQRQLQKEALKNMHVNINHVTKYVQIKRPPRLVPPFFLFPKLNFTSYENQLNTMLKKIEHRMARISQLLRW